MKIIERNIPKITELCKKYRVKTLAVFGSVLTDKFHDSSDIDFLVSFDTLSHENWDYVGNFFKLKEGLESLFSREIDLVVEKGLKNKYFIQNVNRTKKLIYG